MNWIKAENPPKDMHEVLITVKNKVTLGHYNYSKKEWFEHNYYEPVNVSHWMPLPSAPKEGEMNEDAEKLKGFLFFIIDEHKAACRKHPKFCDEIIPPGFDFSEEEKRWKKWNDEATVHYASDLFYEEYFEFLNAYQQADKEHALQELAQCGAVILRIMETIEKEIADK